MKKTIACVFATATIATGALLAAGGAPASAAPYPGTVKTASVTVVPGNANPGNKARVCGKVFLKGTRQDAGTGTVTITVTKAGTVVSTTTVTYTGGSACTKTPSLSQGTYKVVVKYTPAPNSVYKASNDSDTFTVNKRKH